MLVNFMAKDLSFTHSMFRYLNTESNSVFHWNSKITTYFKKRDIENARKLFDKMPQKNLVSWNCMISGYVKNGMISEARKLFNSMPIKNVVSWTAMLNGYAKNGRLEEARVLFDAVRDKNIVCWNSMISGYVSCGRIKEARALFNAMPVKNDVSCGTIIEGYFKYGDVADAERLFNEVSSRSISICNAMLAGYGERMQINELCDLFRKMVNRDVVSWTTMISCFAKAGEVERAREFFDEMPERDVVAWTVMIQGYVDNGNFDLASELFNQMPFKDIVAWNSMLSGYVRYQNLEDASDFFVRMPQRNVVSWNVMLEGYLQLDDITRALKFFEGIPGKDETSWNIMISKYQNEEAFALYVQMLYMGLRPNQGTLTSVISISSILSNNVWGKLMHVFVVKNGFENDCVVMSSLISMYSRCGFIDDASQIFRAMQNSDTVVWNSMIVAQARHFSAEVAFGLFTCMIDAGIQPDHVTFLVLLTACAHSGLVSEGWKYLELMKKWNLEPKPEHYACMVDLLGKSGLVNEAFELVNQLPVDLPAYAWETLLSACSIYEKYEVSDLIAEKILRKESCDVDMCVLQSNIFSARGMWKAAADIRAKVKCRRLKKEVGCSWMI